MSSSDRVGAYVGVDAGSSGCKAVLIEGKELRAEAWAAYPTKRGPDGSVTQDARDWLHALKSTVRDCVAAARGRVEGLAVTGPAHNAVLVQKDGLPRGPVILWSDARPSLVAAKLRRTYGPEFVERTNVRLDATWTLPQLAWLRSENARAFEGLAHVLVGKDYLRYRLTGVAATDPTDAAGTALYDPRAEAWIGPLVDEHGLADLLPPVRRPVESGGSLTRSAARALGLRAGTPVVVGATDTAAELFSVNAVAPGDAIVKVATTGTVVSVMDQPPDSDLLLTYPHVIDGRWYSVAATSSAAAAYAWLSRLLPSNDGGFTALDKLARRAPAGAGGLLFLPYLDGERTPHWDRDLRAAFLGLSSVHAAPHLCRAVLEGVALSLRSCWDAQIGAGARLNDVRLTGGGLASALWRSILVSALGFPATRVEPQGPALGSALLAAEGLTGRIPALVRRRLRSTPRPADRLLYERLYGVYTRAGDNLREVSHDLARFTQSPGSPSLAPGSAVDGR